MKPVITDISQLDLNKQYTYADYLTWQFSERLELIKGWIYKMPASPSGGSPAPRRVHQEIEGKLFLRIGNYFEHKNCKVYQSPFDVRLLKNVELQDKAINTVV